MGTWSPRASLEVCWHAAVQPKVRDSLVQLEDTLIYALAERAKWGRNDPIYVPGTVTMPGGQALSLLEYVLCEREYLEGRLGRYTQQEREFMPGCAAPSALPPVPVSRGPTRHLHCAGGQLSSGSAVTHAF